MGRGGRREGGTIEIKFKKERVERKKEIKFKKERKKENQRPETRKEEGRGSLYSVRTYKFVNTCGLALNAQ